MDGTEFQIIYLAEAFVGLSVVAYAGYKSLDYLYCIKSAMGETALMDRPSTKAELLTGTFRRVNPHLRAYRDLGQNEYIAWVAQRLQ
jgi:hypothetical protein